MAKLSLHNVGKSFDGVPALHEVTAQIADGEFVALLGPSGCGKTTLLRMLAGFEAPTSGRISIGETTVADGRGGRMVPPEARNIGIVFQSYALWPHMDVARNVSYPLEVRGLSKQERHRRVEAALAATELQAYRARMPAELSGGQRQRVALARCLVADPEAVLLDEPLANLDVALRAAMHDVFTAFHQRTKATMVYVTHDQAEAMALADRIAVMSAGRIVQFDQPEVLYARPQTRFVAEFIGQGSVVPITKFATNADRHQAEILGQMVAVDTDCAAPGLACIRPENITLCTDGSQRAQVRRATYLGGRYRLLLQTETGAELLAETRQRCHPGEQVGFVLKQPWCLAE